MLKPKIKLLETNEEYRKCEMLQRSTWGGVSVSAEVMLVTQKSGGAVLGAFVKGRMVGFIYALLARRNGRIIHWSHMMGVLPDYRSQGLGLQLKIAHRRLAFDRGIKSICWTFDPLQSRNASLNLARLGGRVEEYVVNYYGRFESRIEQGLPSDRFVVNWPIASKGVERSLSERSPKNGIPKLPRINLTTCNEQGFLVNQKLDLGRHERSLLVEIPSNTDQMRAVALTLARRWRFQVRKIFLHYLSNGYQVDGFLTENGKVAGLRCYYLLRRGRG